MNWVVYRTGEDESEEFETLEDAIRAMNDLLSVSLCLSKNTRVKCRLTHVCIASRIL